MITSDADDLNVFTFFEHVQFTSVKVTTEISWECKQPFTQNQHKAAGHTFKCWCLNSPGQISLLSSAPPRWRVWLESHSGPCDTEGCRWFVTGSAACWGDPSPTAVTTQSNTINSFKHFVRSCSINDYSTTILLLHSKHTVCWHGCTNLCHVSDQVEGDIRESFVEIPTHHIDPRGAVTCVWVCFIQSHDMSKVGELGVLLFKAYLHTKRARVWNTELSMKQNEDRNIDRSKPGLSSLQHLCRTAWVRQSSALGVGAGREHSRGNLMKKQTN